MIRGKANVSTLKVGCRLGGDPRTSAGLEALAQRAVKRQGAGFPQETQLIH